MGTLRRSQNSKQRQPPVRDWTQSRDFQNPTDRAGLVKCTIVTTDEPPTSEMIDDPEERPRTAAEENDNVKKLKLTKGEGFSKDDHPGLTLQGLDATNGGHP